MRSFITRFKIPNTHSLAHAAFSIIIFVQRDVLFSERDTSSWDHVCSATETIVAILDAPLPETQILTHTETERLVVENRLYRSGLSFSLGA